MRGADVCFLPSIREGGVVIEAKAWLACLVADYDAAGARRLTRPNSGQAIRDFAAAALDLVNNSASIDKTAVAPH
jgi:hypothetical protein